ALLPDFDRNGARPPRAVSLTDLGCLAARQGDLLAFRRAVRPTQRLEELRLIRVGDRVIDRSDVNAGGTQLLQQYVRGHFQFNGELGDGVTRHSTLSCLQLLQFSIWTDPVFS